MGTEKSDPLDVDSGCCDVSDHADLGTASLGSSPLHEDNYWHHWRRDVSGVPHDGRQVGSTAREGSLRLVLARRYLRYHSHVPHDSWHRGEYQLGVRVVHSIVADDRLDILLGVAGLGLAGGTSRHLSVPFISLVVCHFGNLFLLFFYQNSMMLYLTKALGFQLTKGGAAASLPWAGRMLFGFFFSWAGDTIKRKELLSITNLRKVATIFSHLVPGICLILVGYVGCSLVLANLFLILALGFNGAASIANLSNNQDLSPNYAGFLYGIMNTIGCMSGIIISPMVEEIAGKYGNPIGQWRILFWIGAAVCILCMIVFLFGGSGNIQSWNDIRLDTDDAESGGKQGTTEAAKT